MLDLQKQVHIFGKETFFAGIIILSGFGPVIHFVDFRYHVTHIHGLQNVECTPRTDQSSGHRCGGMGMGGHEVIEMR